MVLDKNYFQNPKLDLYLSKSPLHKVVLNEYAMIESYKGDSIKNIQKSLEILSRYPEQVIVLKGMRQVVNASPLVNGLQKRLIDQESTSGFVEFCNHIALAVDGDSSLLAQIRIHGEEARKRLENFKEPASVLAENVHALKRHYSNEDINEYRANGLRSHSLKDKVLKHITLLFALLHGGHPDTSGRPKIEDVPQMYLFRMSVPLSLLMLRRLAHGGYDSTGEARRINDLVDTHYIASATYFDGLLTADTQMMNIYRHSRYFLKEFKKAIK